MFDYEDGDETHKMNALKTILALLENIDCSDFMQVIIDQLVTVNIEEYKTLKHQLVCTYAMCFFNTPATTYQILSEKNEL